MRERRRSLSRDEKIAIHLQAASREAYTAAQLCYGYSAGTSSNRVAANRVTLSLQRDAADLAALARYWTT